MARQSVGELMEREHQSTFVILTAMSLRFVTINMKKPITLAF